jgi:ribosome-binding protein aMBF1 (putative translation factor)
MSKGAASSGRRIRIELTRKRSATNALVTKTKGAPGASRQTRTRSRKTRSTQPAQIVRNGRVEWILVPPDEYERLVKADMIEEAANQNADDADTEWVDADDLALGLAADRISRARKAAGLTQKQLADKLGIPQSQISRIERNPDRTTVRTLKRIAQALRVDVSKLV